MCMYIQLPSVECSVVDDVMGAGVVEVTSCDVPAYHHNKYSEIHSNTKVRYESNILGECRLESAAVADDGEVAVMYNV